MEISNEIEKIHLASWSIYNQKNRLINLGPKFLTQNNSYEFTITNDCTKNFSSFISINANSNQTIFFYLKNNHLKYASLKYNTLDVAIGNSQLKFVAFDTNSTFGILKSTVEKGKIKKDFKIQTNFYKIKKLLCIFCSKLRFSKRIFLKV